MLLADALALNLEAIRAKREKLGLTMDSAAQAAGINGRQSWYQIESGRRADVAISTLGKIAKALKCKPEDLLK